MTKPSSAAGLHMKSERFSQLNEQASSKEASNVTNVYITEFLVVRGRHNNDEDMSLFEVTIMSREASLADAVAERPFSCTLSCCRCRTCRARRLRNGSSRRAEGMRPTACLSP